jgi:hypothetical protein
MSDLSPGDRVRDVEGDEGDDHLTVVRIHEERADEYVLFEEPGGHETTVATFHLGKYPSDDSVIEVVYGDGIETHEGEVLPQKKCYAFPESRLSALDEDGEGSA